MVGPLSGPPQHTLTNCISDFLEISRSASQSDINKAYRKRSRVLHPDKAKQSLIASRAKAKPTQSGAKPTVHVNKPPSARELRNAEKEASERFTRLGLITEILRGEGRERYDFFLDNGFPKWRGTGYYYARFRPGATSVLLSMFVFGGGLVHYIVLVLGYKRQRDFVKRYIGTAQKAAWGEERKQSALRNVTGLGAGNDDEEGATVIDEDYEVPEAPRNRRERREQEKEAKRKKKEKERKRDRSTDPSGTSTPYEGNVQSVDSLSSPVAGGVTPAPGPKKQVEAENGKILVVDSQGKVFLEEEDEETGESQLFLLDPEEIERPSFKQTVLWRLPVWAYALVKERVSKKDQTAQEEAADQKPTLDGTPEGEWEDGDTIIVQEEGKLNGEATPASGGKKARKRRGKK